MPERPVPHHPLPNGRPTDAVASPPSVSALRERVSELEDLCAELYEAAVALGLPQPLMNKLWVVAARGSVPRTFDVDLPSAAPEAPQAPPLPDVRLIHDPFSRGPSQPLQPLEPFPERRTVFMVDDDPAILQVAKRILSHENYDLIDAPTGVLALEKYNALGVKVDLLITDYVMPGMNGRELAKHFRERDPYIKVLYETGFTDLLFAHRLEVEPNAAFIEKPFSARGLQEAARLLLFGRLNPQPLQRSA